MEAAFAQLAAENRRLKAKGRVGHVSEAVPLSVEGNGYRQQRWSQALVLGILV